APDCPRQQEPLRFDPGGRRLRDALGGAGRGAVAVGAVPRRAAGRGSRIGRRTAAGVDTARVSLLLAVLAQRAACDVLANDVFVNLAGGARVSEPAVDLGVALAIASAARRRPIDARTVVFGEVGLAGEVRAVSLPEMRLIEARKLGFTRCLIPKRN